MYCTQEVISERRERREQMLLQENEEMKYHLNYLSGAEEVSQLVMLSLKTQFNLGHQGSSVS